MNHPNRRLFAAIPEAACGPGWANQIVYMVYHAEDGSGKLEREILQAKDLGPEAAALFPVVLAAVNQFREVCEWAASEKRKGAKC